MMKNTDSGDDPFEHPDLVGLARRMRQHLEEVLAAERAAARAMARRQLTLRDRMCDLEDLSAKVEIQWPTGAAVRGMVVDVGLDYFELRGSAGRFLVPFSLAGWVRL